ncbi:MAG: DUF2026 domain-containing protein [Chromatiaceae bacterium]|jgi:hypothetical protein|nr:DUF2026 domain-containing protein [Chromatiaceae bacterium]
MPKSKRLLITLPEYERIFRVIHGALKNEQGDPAKACLFFGIIGARILQTHYKLNAVPLVGHAIYRLSATEDLLGLGVSGEHGVTSTEEGFHCWVLCEDWSIDFHAPLFPEMLSNSGARYSVPRQMFQKPIARMSQSADDLTTVGSFIYGYNEELTRYSIAQFYSLQAHNDIEDICTQWFNRNPQKMQQHLLIGDQNGNVNHVPLSPLKVTGAW